MDDSPPKRSRRSSILKASRAPLSDLVDGNEFDEDRTTYTRTATLKRRVSFSSTNKVQEFCNEADVIWGEKYEKPMMPPDAKANSLPSIPTSLESSKSFQDLLTGEIKSAPACLNVRSQIQFTYSESQTSSYSAPQVPDCVQSDEEMELTAPNVAVYSQGSQSSMGSQGPSQVTMVDRQPLLPVAIDKENLTIKHLDSNGVLNKTNMSSANMSMGSQVDPEASLLEDASYLNSPKGFNTTRFSENGLDETDDNSDVMDILKGGLNKSLRPFNKTVNETMSMDVTTFQNNNPQAVEEEEEKTEDLAKSIINAGNVTSNQHADIEEDITLEMFKEHESQSSVDTEEVVPKESIFSLSKHRRSLSFNHTGSSANAHTTMEISMAPMEMSVAPMESFYAPAELTTAPMDVTLAARNASYMQNVSKDLIQPPIPDMDSSAPLFTNLNKTSVQPLDMSIGEIDEKEIPAASKLSRESLDHTKHLTADLTVDKRMGNWNAALSVADNTKDLVESSSINITSGPSKDIEVKTPERCSSAMDISRGAPRKSFINKGSSSSEENLAPLNMTGADMTLVDEPSKFSVMNKTFDVSVASVIAPAVLDSTDANVPDETGSDNVFVNEDQIQCTEVNSRKSHQTITTYTQRIVDKIHDESFSSENTKIEETSKDPRVSCNPDAMKYSQMEDIGEVCIGETGHMSVSMKHVEKTGMMVSPEQSQSKQVDLSNGQELLLSPKNKQVVTVVDRTPEKATNETASRSVRTSPLCRSFNAPNIVITSATSEDTDASTREVPKAVEKHEQKSRRQPVEHSPIKKACTEPIFPPFLEYSASKKCSSAPNRRYDLDSSRRNVSRGNFEADFMRNNDFEANLMRNNDIEASNKMPEEFDCSRRSEMETSRRNKTIECSEMSISFLPPETGSKAQQSFAEVLEDFDAILPKKKCTELDVISRKIDEIILWYKQRQEENQKTETKENKSEPEEAGVEMMDVEQAEPETPLTPVAAKLKEMGHKYERSWRVVKNDESGMEFSILNNTMTMNIIIDGNDHVTDITLSRSSKSVATVEEFCHKIFTSRLNSRDLLEICKIKNDIPSLMKVINPKLVSFTNLIRSLQRASSKYILSFSGSRVAFQCFSRELLLVFQVYVDLANWDKLKEDDVEVKTVVGDLKCEEVKELISYERANENFLLKYIQSVEEFISTKENFA